MESPKLLKAGALRAELGSDGGLRNIMWGEDQVLQRLYVAVRDENWGTVPGRVSDLDVTVDANRFTVRFQSNHVLDDISFLWVGRITGESSGALSYSMEGSAQSSFLKNRIGFCLLHSMECAGRPITVTQKDGTVLDGVLPVAISPDQPFKDIVSLQTVVSNNITTNIRLHGDIFEMEDQRNWTDASYKTYCTPLSQPFPVKILAGDSVVQSVQLSIAGDASYPLSDNHKNAALKVCCSDPSKLPEIGLEISENHHSSAAEKTLLSAMNLAHLRVSLHLDEPGYRRQMTAALILAAEIGVKLEVALFASTATIERESECLASLLCSASDIVSRWLVLSPEAAVTQADVLKLAQSILSPLSPNATIIGGTDHYFAELNRNHEKLPPLDGLCYSINPQVHAFDDESLIETLSAQQVTALCAGQFQPGASIVVSPVTLKPRSNPNSTSVTSECTEERGDPRQKHSFAAAWTLGSIISLTKGKVRSATFYETFGDKGVMDGKVAFPVYRLIKDVTAFGADAVLSVNSSKPQSVIGICLCRGRRFRAIVANITGSVQQFTLDMPFVAREVTLGADSSMTLEAYGVETIDWFAERITSP